MKGGEEKMTKKEFKKKCRKDKTGSYKLMLYGGIISVIACIIIVITFAFIKTSPNQIIGYVIAGVVAFVGMLLDLIGEVITNKNYKKITGKC